MSKPIRGEDVLKLDHITSVQASILNLALEVRRVRSECKHALIYERPAEPLGNRGDDEIPAVRICQSCRHVEVADDRPFKVLAGKAIVSPETVDHLHLPQWLEQAIATLR